MQRLDGSQSAVIFVVSDSIGETAEQVARAAASQFERCQPDIRRMPYVEDDRAILAVLDEAGRTDRSIIIYTMIVPRLRDLLAEEAHRRQIPAVDIMGPVMDAFATVMAGAPKLEPGLIRRLDEEYFRRIEALEFAVKYDDGKDPRGALRADVVLVGVSRSSKTPVSMYLAHRGYRTANVPLIPELEPPAELFMLKRGVVVGLTLDAEKLLEIRQERLKTIGLENNSQYANMGRILEELRYARSVFTRLGCPVIDVTHKAVEETANMVLEIMRKGEKR